MTSDGYRWGYVSFAHVLLYFSLSGKFCSSVSFTARLMIVFKVSLQTKGKDVQMYYLQ